MDSDGLVSEAASSSIMNCLPHEVMLEILSRLPARSLGRLRCVCKLWNSLFHDPYFVRRQVNHASKNPTIFFGYSPMGYELSTDEVTLYSFKIEENAVVLGNKLTVAVRRQVWYRMSNSCNGLIAFYGAGYAYVANPCTREWMDLPEFTPHMVEAEGFMKAPRTSLFSCIALGFSAATGKYKLVRIFCCDGYRWVCEVLTLGTDRSWRPLGDMSYPITEFAPAYASGYIYWTIDGCENVGILSFDVCQEKFTTIRPPPQCHPEPCVLYRHLCMRVLEGLLCLIDWRVHSDDEEVSYLPVMHIYVLKHHKEDDSSSMWTKSRCFSLRSVKVRSKRGFNRRPAAKGMFPIAIEGGKALLYRRCKNWRLHDMETGACTTIRLPPLTCMRTRALPFVCAESIVAIDRLPEQLTIDDPSLQKSIVPLLEPLMTEEDQSLPLLEPLMTEDNVGDCIPSPTLHPFGWFISFFATMWQNLEKVILYFFCSKQ